MRKYHTFELALLLALAAALLWGAWSLRRQDDLQERMIRLHVIANSDSDADQTLKLHVRDAVLCRAEDILRQSADMADARRRLTDALPAMGGRRRVGAGRRGAAPIPSPSHWRKRSFLSRHTTASPCPPGNIWPSGWSSGRGRAATGGAWCTRPCVPPPPAIWRRRRAAVA